MKISIIICSCDRPDILPVCLASVAAEAALYGGTEIVLVHRVDDAPTAEVMRSFAATSRAPVKVLHANKRGLSIARNVGIAGASGDVLFFTDDDCLMKPGHLGALIAEMENEPTYAYGGGGVHDAVFSAPDTTHIAQKTVINPYTLFLGGFVSGCNMFFRKEVFQKLGGFREDMGAGSGTSFIGAEDLEMAARASFAGMTGVILPGAIIVHDHGRQPDSQEHKKNSIAYDIMRGSFFAYMLMRGINDVWKFWGSSKTSVNGRKLNRAAIECLQREFYGAAEYLDYCLKNNVDL